MECSIRVPSGLAVSLVAVASAQCSPGAPRAAALASDPVLECRAADIRHVLRIRRAAGAVDDLTFTPAKSGTADVRDAEYVLSFHESRDNYDLVLRIDKASGRGTRRLFDDEQQAIQGHGGTDDITCITLADAR